MNVGKRKMYIASNNCKKGKSNNLPLFRSKKQKNQFHFIQLGGIKMIDLLNDIEKLQKNTEDITNIAIAMENATLNPCIYDQEKMFFVSVTILISESHELIRRIALNREYIDMSIDSDIDNKDFSNLSITKICEENMDAKQRLANASKCFYSLLTKSEE